MPAEPETLPLRLPRKQLPEQAMEIAKRIIRREFGVKRIVDADVNIWWGESCGYCVSYRGKFYRLR